MSLEDLDSDFLSDEADDEAEKSVSDENDDDDEANYEALVHLHNNLMCFDHIYTNNIMLDMQHRDDAWSNFESESVGSELSLIQDYVNGVFEEAISGSYSATPPEDGSQSDTEEADLQHIQDFVQLFEEVVSTSSSVWSAASEATEGQIEEAGDMNNGAAEEPL